MDSGNSGSLHSSSGGDEEYDSRAAYSTFINPPAQSHLRPIPTAPPPPLFDPLSNYVHFQNPSQPSWPRPAPTMRSDPDPSSSHATFSNPGTFQATAESNGRVKAAARNPRKRSRASRRDPTTVLTTDTTNFRAMVQEFTGIPASPFNGGGSSPFGTRSAAFEAAPPYHRRPFAYQLPAEQNSHPFNVQNPNSLTYLLRSNPGFLFSSSGAAAKLQDHQDSFGFPRSEFDDIDLSIHGNHVASTTLNGLPNLVSPHQLKTAAAAAASGGYSFSDGKATSYSAAAAVSSGEKECDEEC